MDNWKSWCRLCGDSENACIPLTNPGIDNLSLMDNIKQSIIIGGNDSPDLPGTICEDCENHVLSICQFVQKCAKVQKMYNALLDTKTADAVESILKTSKIQFDKSYMLAEDVQTIMCGDVIYQSIKVDPDELVMDDPGMSIDYDETEDFETGDDHEQPDVNSSLVEVAQFWNSDVGSRNATEALLEILNQPSIQSVFTGDRNVKIGVWKQVNKLLIREGFRVPGRNPIRKVRQKYCNLMKTYKKFLEESRRVGRAPRKPPRYFKLLNSILQGKEHNPNFNKRTRKSNENHPPANALIFPPSTADYRMVSDAEILDNAEDEYDEPSSIEVAQFWNSNVGNKNATETLIKILHEPRMYARLMEKGIKVDLWHTVTELLSKQGFFVPGRNPAGKVRQKYSNLLKAYKRYTIASSMSRRNRKPPTYYKLLHSKLKDRYMDCQEFY